LKNISVKNKCRYWQTKIKKKLRSLEELEIEKVVVGHALLVNINLTQKTSADIGSVKTSEDEDRRETSKTSAGTGNAKTNEDEEPASYAKTAKMNSQPAKSRR
jgi:hypothetical protein